MHDEIDDDLNTLLIWYDIAERYVPRPRQPGPRGPADLLAIAIQCRSTPGYPWRDKRPERIGMTINEYTRERLLLRGFERRLVPPHLTDVELDRWASRER